MAGKPKRMAARVAALVDRAFALDEDLGDLIPLTHLQDASGSDPLGRAWRDALDGVGKAFLALYELAGILRGRAGIEDRELDDEIDTPVPTDPAHAESQGGAQPDPG